ncbi:MAG: TatD family hydrolase [Verrucomicrobiota bacterium]
MLTDTHAHLDFPEYEQDLPDVMERAKTAGVSKIITISTSLEGSARAVALANKWPCVKATVGVHPCYVDESPEVILPELRKLASDPHVVGIGETGIDYHRNQTPPEDSTALATWIHNREKQARFFDLQLSLAVELGLNVVVHQRDSWDDTLRILRPYSGKLKAVYHCFGGTLAQAQELIALGFLVSFTGIVTFKNAVSAQEAAAKLPAGSFFLETDCPFLAPVPHRGKRCEPGHTRLIAEHIAKLRCETLEQVAAHTSAAADVFFQRR